VSGLLLDTNVPSELTRPIPDVFVVRGLDDADEREMFISAISLGEIRKGTSELPLGAKRRDLEQWIETTLRPWFADRILPVNDIVAERWGTLSAELRSQGRPIGMADGLIAATALVHKLTVVTRNVKHFFGLSLDVINPWEP
jgi:predicted nucleic acid-binding protein